MKIPQAMNHGLLEISSRCTCIAKVPRTVVFMAYVQDRSVVQIGFIQWWRQQTIQENMLEARISNSVLDATSKADLERNPRCHVRPHVAETRLELRD